LTGILLALTQGNVALVRTAYRAFNEWDVETLNNLATTDFVLEASSATDGQRHQGPGAFDEIFEAIRERWADFRLDPLEFYEAGERVLVLGTLVARDHDRNPFASVAGQVWTLREGKLAALEAFLSSEEAIRAAGLSQLLT
jgi:ketosteroid isomerase-like protein